MKRPYLGLLLLLFCLTNCQAQTCDGLPTSFESYQSAMQQITTTTFKKSETLDTSKSSWIKGAEFHSCDLVTGYLILKTSKSEYLHAGVPLELWNEFKKASSYGQFYNARIKGRYELKLR